MTEKRALGMALETLTNARNQLTSIWAARKETIDRDDDGSTTTLNLVVLQAEALLAVVKHLEGSEL